MKGALLCFSVFWCVWTWRQLFKRCLCVSSMLSEFKKITDIDYAIKKKDGQDGFWILVLLKKNLTVVPYM